MTIETLKLLFILAAWAAIVVFQFSEARRLKIEEAVDILLKERIIERSNAACRAMIVLGVDANRASAAMRKLGEALAQIESRETA